MPAEKEPIGLKKGQHLDDIDHPQIEEDDYKRKLKDAQLKLLTFQRAMSETKRSLVVLRFVDLPENIGGFEHGVVRCALRRDRLVLESPSQLATARWAHRGGREIDAL